MLGEEGRAPILEGLGVSAGLAGQELAHLLEVDGVAPVGDAFMHTGQDEYSLKLRREIAVKATEYAHNNLLSYYCGKHMPTEILFRPAGYQRHGNFSTPAYRAILKNPDWARLLDLPYADPKWLPEEHREHARQHDSTLSSLALLMNIFCHPDAQGWTPLARAFGLAELPEPVFAATTAIPRADGSVQHQQISMLLGDLRVKAVLTDTSFEQMAVEELQAYAGAADLLDLTLLACGPGMVAHGRLLMHALELHSDPHRRFVMVIDARRPDLAQVWEEVYQAIRAEDVRDRWQLITWQELAACSPDAVKPFLREKYGIEPVEFGRLAGGTRRFDVPSANRALRTLYEQRLNDLFSAIWGSPGLSHPHLIQVPFGYGLARKRLMIVGQQTAGWGEGEWLGDGPGEQPVGTLMEAYAEFGLGQHYRETPFWSASYDLQGLLNPEGPAQGFIWSNLIKVDWDGGRPDEDIEDWCCGSFGVLPEEVTILKPDVIVFFTGPDYDGRLLQTFPGACFQRVYGHELRQLARVQAPQLPVRTFRTYHPKYLRLSGKWALLEHIARLCD